MYHLDMGLKSYSVELVGRVCYLTERGQWDDATVECPERRMALRVRVPSGALRIGDWSAVAGTVRLDPGLDRSGEPREKNLAYLHEPHDGSPRRSWIFFQVQDGSARRAFNPSVVEAVRRAAAGLEALSVELSEGRKGSVERLLEALEEAERVVRKVSDRNPPEKIASIELVI